MMRGGKIKLLLAGRGAGNICWKMATCSVITLKGCIGAVARVVVVGAGHRDTTEEDRVVIMDVHNAAAEKTATGKGAAGKVMVDKVVAIHPASTGSPAMGKHLTKSPPYPQSTIFLRQTIEIQRLMVLCLVAITLSK